MTFSIWFGGVKKKAGCFLLPKYELLFVDGVYPLKFSTNTVQLFIFTFLPCHIRLLVSSLLIATNKAVWIALSLLAYRYQA